MEMHQMRGICKWICHFGFCLFNLLLAYQLVVEKAGRTNRRRLKAKCLHCSWTLPEVALSHHRESMYVWMFAAHFNIFPGSRVIHIKTNRSAAALWSCRGCSQQMDQQTARLWDERSPKEHLISHKPLDADAGQSHTTVSRHKRTGRRNHFSV